MTSDESSTGSQRLVSLDVLRGLTIAGMMVVNTPGSWEHVFPQLLHAEWNGWTYTDTIFPFFLFIVGVSMALAFDRRRRGGKSRRSLTLHTVRRAAIIVLLGLALNGISALVFHHLHYDQIRIPGVLQRIGVCFLVAGLVLLFLGRKSPLPAAGLLLISYWLLMTLVPVPGYGAGRLDAEGNLAAYLDRTILGSHTWKHDPSWDPEGLLSTIPAIATTLLGAAAGQVLLASSGAKQRVVTLLAGGAVAFSLGLIWSVFFPINKNLWTSSYALFMAGLAAMALSACMAIVDVEGRKAWLKPFEWLGTNAIALFVASDLATILLLGLKLTGPDGKPRSLYRLVYRSVFDHFTDERISSVLFALVFCAVWIAVGGLLYRRKIFLKI